MWKYGTSSSVFSSPSYYVTSSDTSRAKGRIVCGGQDSNVYCLTEEGGPVWTYKTDSKIYSSPLVFTLCKTCKSSTKSVQQMGAENIGDIRQGCADCYCVVCVCCTAGYLYILDSADGKLLTSCQLKGEVFSSPVFYDGFLTVGCRDNNVYCWKVSIDILV